MVQLKPPSVPLLIVGDNPALATGLARSGRDIATLAQTLPEFRVGFLGRGLGQSRRFPFIVYDYPESGGWGENLIEDVWRDFARDVPGVILTTDDPSRRRWFANPSGLSEAHQRFLGPGRNFQKWGYFPIDSTGPAGMALGLEARDAVGGYDRVLATSEWGRDVLRASGRSDADWLPHGIHGNVFHVYPDARKILGWDEDLVRVGFVASNQARKDFPVAFETFAILRKVYGNRFRAWVHTDEMIRYWNLYALAGDYGVGDVVEITTALTDEALGVRYSGCDSTILPSGGEGFGFPIAESQACGTACVVPDYSAAQEIVPETCRVRPVGFRIDTVHNVRRAVLSGWGFAEKVQVQVEMKRRDWEWRSEEVAGWVGHLDWGNLRGLWTRWMLGGLG
jgi:glycosyltransferase involved in cell wall biosynthesis